MERLSEAGLPRIFGALSPAAEQNECLRHLAHDLQEYRKSIEQVFIQFVFKGDIDAAENSEGLSSRREDLENKQHLLEQFFGRPITLRVDFISDRPGAGVAEGPQTFDVAITGAVKSTYGERQLIVGFVRLMDLLRIHQVLRHRFFDRNIRAALSADNAPNKRLRAAFAEIALQEKEDPAVFPFRHNGVTLAAERVSLGDSTATLHVPRLLNGAQTVSSLAKFLDDYAAHGALKKGRERLEDVQVLAKIIQADPSSDFVVEVTIANNQQNPVPPWALRAMDRRQVDLADKFREELGISYSRQEGAFESLSEDERTDLGIDDSKDMRIRALAQTFLAVQGEVDKMSRLPEVFESSTNYENTFKASYALPSTDARNIVLAYKVGLMLNRPMERLGSVAPQRYAPALRRARNLVWALLVQALLNDAKLADDRETHGTNLNKTKMFRDRLETLASSRVWPILKEVLSVPAYQDKLAKEKYDFLRTKEAYKRAMDAAYAKWGWTKKHV